MDGLNPTDNPIDIIMAIEGMLGREEAELLYERAKESRHAIVEIGSYRGRSTVALALGSKAGHNVPVYAIDPHEATEDGYPFGPEDRAAMLKNIVEAGVAALVRVVDFSARSAMLAWDRQSKPIGLLWIDGDHDWAEADLLTWGRWVPSNGCVLLHDRHLLHINSLAEKYADKYDRLRDVGGILQLRKRG